MNHQQLREAEKALRFMQHKDATTNKPLAPVPGSVTVYRLVLSHPDWPRETRTKWQESPDFTKALSKAKELGVTARVESQNDTAHGAPSTGDALTQD